MTFITIAPQNELELALSFLLRFDGNGVDTISHGKPSGSRSFVSDNIHHASEFASHVALRSIAISPSTGVEVFLMEDL